jgi:diacylglycerol kinase (ATP)
MYIIKKLYANLGYSIHGLKVCCGEIAFRLELIYGLIILGLIFKLNTSQTHTLILIIEYTLLLAFELVNTAVEKTCDRITLEYDLQVRYAKDLASAAVFLMVLLNAATIIYLVAFF